MEEYTIDDDPEQFLEEKVILLTDEQSKKLKEHMDKLASDPNYRKDWWKLALKNKSN